MKPSQIIAGTKLTVIIRDDSPMIFCGDSPSYRSVTLTLTGEQIEAIALNQTGQDRGKAIHESISKAFIE